MPVDISWWGHASCTVEDRGVRVLTDPLFTQRLAHLRRRGGQLPPPEARRADVVLVSHLHADHLHLPSLAQVRDGASVVVPRGALAAVPKLRRLGHLRIVETEAGQEQRFGAVKVRAVPARHDGRRFPLGPRTVPALGYVVTGDSRTYFAGDTALFDEMAAEVGPVDTALLPVGGWGPRLGPGHLNAARAAEALARIGAAEAVPVHYGTYWPVGMDAVRPHEFHAPGGEFARLAAVRAPRARVHKLDIGGTVRTGGRS